MFQLADGSLIDHHGNRMVQVPLDFSDTARSRRILSHLPDKDFIWEMGDRVYDFIYTTYIGDGGYRLTPFASIKFFQEGDLIHIHTNLVDYLGKLIHSERDVIDKDQDIDEMRTQLTGYLINVLKTIDGATRETIKKTGKN